MSFYIMMKGKVVSLAQTKAVTDTWEPHKFYSQSSQSLKPSQRSQPMQIWIIFYTCIYNFKHV